MGGLSYSRYWKCDDEGRRCKDVHCAGDEGQLVYLHKEASELQTGGTGPPEVVSKGRTNFEDAVNLTT